MKGLRLRKTALCGILSAFALISFIIESLFPPLFLPGARMGVSNLFILLTLVFLGKRYAYAVLIIKTLLGSIFSANVSAILYSLPAGIIALSIEIILLYFVKNVSILCASITGAVINTTVQNVIFCLITNTPEYLCYLPYLALIATLAGAIIGVATYLIIVRLRDKLSFITKT